MRHVYYRFIRSISTFFIVCIFIALPICSAPIAEDAGKFLGNITSSRNGGISDNFTDYWNQVTPENEGKWGNVERSRDNMSWTNVEDSYRFAKDNNFPFKQHTFVWGNQEPYWIGGLSAEEQREEVEEWIREYSERIPDPDFIDVVNEPISRPASYREALGGIGNTGVDWIVWSFKKAREYFPNSKLLINEYNIINYESNVMGYLAIVKVLQDSGLIDALGIQCHWFSIQDTTLEAIKSNLDLLATSGLPIYVTELDIQGDDDTQCAFYESLFPIFWKHPSVAGITIWGWIQGRTWFENTHLIEGDTERPALKWLREYVKEHPARTMQPLTIASPAHPSLSLHRSNSNDIRLDLYEPDLLSISLYTLTGRTVFSCNNRLFTAGTHRLNIPGNALASGMLYGVVTGSKHKSSTVLTIVK